MRAQGPTNRHVRISLVTAVASDIPWKAKNRAKSIRTAPLPIRFDEQTPAGFLPIGANRFVGQDRRDDIAETAKTFRPGPPGDDREHLEKRLRLRDQPQPRAVAVLPPALPPYDKRRDGLPCVVSLSYEFVR